MAPLHCLQRPATYQPAPAAAAGEWCTYRVEDWWTYEVCYKRHVRQYHKEHKRLVAEFLLGRYSAAESDLNNVQVCLHGGGGAQNCAGTLNVTEKDGALSEMMKGGKPWDLMSCTAAPAGSGSSEWVVPAPHRVRRVHVSCSPQTDTSDVSGAAKYVSQVYNNGDPCDLNDQQRSVEVGGWVAGWLAAAAAWAPM